MTWLPSGGAARWLGRELSIVQFPNVPLLVAFAGRGLAAATHGTAHDVGRVAFAAGLGVRALRRWRPGSTGSVVSSARRRSYGSWPAWPTSCEGSP